MNDTLINEIKLKNSLVNNNEECSICYEKFVQIKNIYMLEKCNHLFCNTCMFKQINTDRYNTHITCAMCRTKNNKNKQYNCISNKKKHEKYINKLQIATRLNIIDYCCVCSEYNLQMFIDNCNHKVCTLCYPLLKNCPICMVDIYPNKLTTHEKYINKLQIATQLSIIDYCCVCSEHNLQLYVGNCFHTVCATCYPIIQKCPICNGEIC